MKYLFKQPKIDESAKIIGGVVVGDCRLEKDVNVWFHATIRGDMSPIHIGEGSNVQDNACVHTDSDYPTTIGRFVTIGHSAIIHGCTIRDHALIGMGAIILNGAEIGEHALVGAGCLVPPGKKVPPRTLVVGQPMRIIRELTEEELDHNKENAAHYIALSKKYLED